MTSTVLDLIDAGFFDDVEAVLIAFFVFFMLKIIQGKTKTAICDDTFDLQKKRTERCRAFMAGL